ncbi:MAG: DNA polymerase III subunit delta [Candidatus Dormibacteraeota bacterium]|nr:DNA polymerase III subunit delta [Candidatus Dormibacteraeota bacterium]
MPRPEHTPILLIHGDEPHLVDASVHEWRMHIRATQLDAEVFDAPARLVDLHRSIAELPLIDPERAILVRDPPQLSSSARRGADSADALAAVLRDRAPSTSVCIVVHGRVAPSNPVLSAVKDLGGTVVFHAQLKRGRELRAWLERDVARRELKLGQGSIDAIMNAAGTDLGVLSTELDKLEALADGRPLTVQQVRRSLASDQSPEMWSVVEELLGPTPARGAAVLDRLLAEGRPTQYLLAILGGQLRDLLHAQSYLALRGSQTGLAAELRIPDWRADRLARQARSVTPAMVMSWLHSLHDADRRVKLGEIGDQDVLRIIGLRAAAQVAASRTAARR